MLLIRCPYCNMKRPETEFRNAGAAHIARPLDPGATSDTEWAAFLYLRDNPKGIIAERWRHAHGCGRFFNAIRNTVTDDFVTTYKAGEALPETEAFASEVAPGSREANATGKQAETAL